MRNVLRTALVALPLLAGCESTTPGPFAIPEPRSYGAATPNPEASYSVKLCPSGDAYYVLGSDIAERARYTRVGRAVTLYGSPRVVLALSEDEETLVYTADAPPLRRKREYESSACPFDAF